MDVYQNIHFQYYVGFFVYQLCLNKALKKLCDLSPVPSPTSNQSLLKFLGSPQSDNILS